MSLFSLPIAVSPPRLDAAIPRRRYSAPLRLRGLHPVPIKADQVQICVAPSHPSHGVFRSRVQFRQEPTRGIFQRFVHFLLSRLHDEQLSMEKHEACPENFSIRSSQ